VIDYAALDGGDSDDDFSTPTPPLDVQPIKKKSKLSKKKSDKSNTVYTSTQLDEVNRPVGRCGRPARRPPEEVQFEKELEEALKISETETESSGEVVKKCVEDVLQNGASSAETLLLGPDNNPINVDDDSKKKSTRDCDQDNENKGHSEIKQVELAVKEKTLVVDDDSDEDFSIARTRKKPVVIESDDDDFEDKPRKTQSELAVPKLTKKLSKKRKLDESWVVSASKKKAPKTNLKPLEDSDDEFDIGNTESKPKTRTPPARVSKAKPIIVHDLNDSDQSDAENTETDIEPKPKQKVDNVKKRAPPAKKDLSDYEESSCSEEDSDEDFNPEVKTINKTPAKKSNKKTAAQTSPIIKKAPKTPTVNVQKTTASQIERLTSPPAPTSLKLSKETYNPAKSPLKPLGLHNIPEKLPAPSTPVLPSLKLAPRTPLSFSGPKVTKTPSNLSGPKLAKTPSNHLHKVNSAQSPSLLTAASPSIAKPFQTPSPMGGARPRLGGGKIPAWTPPARVGDVSSRASACASPSLGLRVGLSRNMKVSKPLHNNVKLE